MRQLQASISQYEEKNYGLVIDKAMDLVDLSVRSFPIQPLNDTDILIEVHASAINFPDVMCINGLYPTQPAYPYVCGFEVAGVVKAVGEGVDTIQVGDEVMALAGANLGGHARYVTVPYHHAIVKPRFMSFIASLVPS